MSAIAVIIPCYNLGRFIQEALDSVVRQTRPPEEILVVDDGSTDLFTRQILAQIERAGTRVTHTPNRGASAARNLGIQLTAAAYIVTLDADDALEPTYLEATVERLEADAGLGFVSTAYQAFGDASYVWTPPACDVVTALTHGAAHVASMFRRRVWQAVGGFDEALRTAEDLNFWISAMEIGFRGEILAAPLLRCRVRRDSKHHRNVAQGGYGRAMQAILSKHRRLIEELGPEILLAKESFLQEQRAHQRHIESRRLVLEDEAGRLQEEVARLTAELGGVGDLRWIGGDLRRPGPISPFWGLERGQPLDRYYIEKFLERHRADIRGRVLEIKDSGYTNRFGGRDVTEREVLDIDRDNPNATVIADLTAADGIPSDHFDCFILTQTLHIIYEVRAALAHAHRILKPEGVLLCSLPAVSRVNYENGGLDSGDHWRFTEASVRRLFSEVFPVDGFEVVVFGNIMACTAFLYGLAPHELTPSERDRVDPWFPLGFCVRAVKRAARQGTGDHE